MTIHIDIPDLVEKLELDQPLTAGERMFLITICNVMYNEDTLDHISQPGDRIH